MPLPPFLVLQVSPFASQGLGDEKGRAKTPSATLVSPPFRVLSLLRWGNPVVD